MKDEMFKSITNDAYEGIYAVLRHIRPWTSKRSVWKECKDILTEYRAALDEYGYKSKEQSEKLKGKELHKYKVTVGYDRFPYYYDIKRNGDWYLFCDGFKVVAIRHKDEKVDHTIYFKDVILDATSTEDARDILEHNSKYHICSFEFEELAGGV